MLTNGVCAAPRATEEWVDDSADDGDALCEPGMHKLLGRAGLGLFVTSNLARRRHEHNRGVREVVRHASAAAGRELGGCALSSAAATPAFELSLGTALVQMRNFSKNREPSWPAQARPPCRTRRLPSCWQTLQYACHHPCFMCQQVQLSTYGNHIGENLNDLYTFLTTRLKGARIASQHLAACRGCSACCS